jgi:hypothetical protein
MGAALVEGIRSKPELDVTFTHLKGKQLGSLLISFKQRKNHGTRFCSIEPRK